MAADINDFLWHQVNGNDEAAVRASLAEAPELALAADASLGTTALICASHRGFTGIVGLLLEKGADVHARERVSDSTALHWACEGGHPVVARMLVECSAALDPIDSWWALPPIGWAVVVEWAPHFRENRPATIDYLLGVGARLDIFSAVARGQEDEVRAAAAPAGALSRRMGFAGGGIQPLHLAVTRRHPALVALLLDLGADVRGRTSSGFTALALAEAAQDSALEALLRSRGAVNDVSSAIVRGDAAALQRHLADPVAPAELAAFLFAASEAGRAALIEPLVARGADPDARAKRLIREVPTLVTPLHMAAMQGNAPVAAALLKAGANPSAGSDEKIPTPLHLAAGGGHVELVRALLRGGADAKATESVFGATPAGWAQHANHAGVVEALREAG